MPCVPFVRQVCATREYSQDINELVADDEGNRRVAFEADHTKSGVDFIADCTSSRKGCQIAACSFDAADIGIGNVMAGSFGNSVVNALQIQQGCFAKLDPMWHALRP